MSNIKAGYQLLVTSWENDGDCYNTKSLEGLTKESCSLLVRLCDIIKNSKRSGRYLGTNPDREQYILDNHRDVVLAYFESQEYNVEYPFEPEQLEDYLSDLIYELVGYSYESDHPRTLEEYIVYYHPVEVKDVTEDFQ